MKKIIQKLLILTLIISIIIPYLPINIVNAAESYLDQLHTYQFSMDNVTYQLPIKVSELENNGWKLKHNKEDLYSFSILYTYMTKGDKDIQVGVINPTTTASDNYDDFIVFSIQGDNITLPGKIKAGSTRDDVRTVYGTPYHKGSNKKAEGLQNTLDAYYYMDYIENDYEDKEFESIHTSGVSIYSDKNSIVTSIQLEYLDLDINTLLEQNKPTIIYDAPTTLGKSILSFQIQLEGDLYRIPAPLTSFIGNGWSIAGICDPNTNKLVTTELPEYMYLGSSQYIRLAKNGHYLYAQVTNEDTTVQKLENCTVTSVSFTNTKTPKFLLPNNLNTLTTTQKLLSTYKSDSYRKSSVGKKTNYTYYDYRTKDYPNKYHQHSDGYYSGLVTFTTSNGSVSKITLTHTTQDFISAVHVDVNEKSAKITSVEDAKEYFSYSNFNLGTWQSSIGYVIHFGDDNTIDAYDAGAGNPWFLQSGDTVDAVATYSFDIQNNTILIHDYDRTIKVKYDIINSERVFITVNGYTQEFTTTHVNVSENGPAKVLENITLKKGYSKLLTPTLPSGVTYHVSYQSSNKKVVTISSKGKIIGVKKGSTTITTTIKIGSITTKYKTYVNVK